MSLFWQQLRDWQSYDTWIVLTGAVVAMSCALPGLWLLLRRQSMMGDALSHTALPAVVSAFLVAAAAQASGLVPAGQFDLFLTTGLFVNAVLVGILTTFLTEWLQKIGRVESSAALGVVFTTLFAFGLVLIRMYADRAHIDADCVLFGTLEMTVLDTVGATNIPKALIVNGIVLAANGLLLFFAFKEVRLSAFDPDMANTIGINSRLIHYALMAVTALAVVAAFETVGSILVVGLLIVPPATALLLSRRFSRVMGLSLGLGVAATLLGHILARAAAPAVFSKLGFTGVQAAGTSGMIATAAGLLFLLAVGLKGAEELAHRFRLTVRIAAEDQLGWLYRVEEPANAGSGAAIDPPGPGWLRQVALWSLARMGRVRRDGDRYVLTDSGRTVAAKLVRAHRLFESYMQKHFHLPDDHLHATAHSVEHFLDEELQSVIEEELDRPEHDPHGKSIPPRGSSKG